MRDQRCSYRIALALWGELSAVDTDRLNTPRARDLEAFNLYLQGPPRMGPAHGGRPESAACSSSSRRSRAIPNFALAYARDWPTRIRRWDHAWPCCRACEARRTGRDGRRPRRRNRSVARGGARLAGRGAEEPVSNGGGRESFTRAIQLKPGLALAHPLGTDLPDAARALPPRRSPRSARRSRSIRCRSARTCRWGGVLLMARR